MHTRSPTAPSRESIFRLMSGVVVGIYLYSIYIYIVHALRLVVYRFRNNGPRSLLSRSTARFDDENTREGVLPRAPIAGLVYAN